jgi:predicted MarR family transcription regulator
MLQKPKSNDFPASRNRHTINAEVVNQRLSEFLSALIRFYKYYTKILTNCLICDRVKYRIWPNLIVLFTVVRRDKS